MVDEKTASVANFGSSALDLHFFGSDKILFCWKEPVRKPVF